MNPNAILALLGDLYLQVSNLTETVTQLRAELEEAQSKRK